MERPGTAKASQLKKVEQFEKKIIVTKKERSLKFFIFLYFSFLIFLGMTNQLKNSKNYL